MPVKIRLRKLEILPKLKRKIIKVAEKTRDCFKMAYSDREGYEKAER